MIRFYSRSSSSILDGVVLTSRLDRRIFDSEVNRIDAQSVPDLHPLGTGQFGALVDALRLYELQAGMVMGRRLPARVRSINSTSCRDTVREDSVAVRFQQWSIVEHTLETEA